MINEDQLEKLAIQWFQDTGWTYAHGPDISPEGRRRRVAYAPPGLSAESHSSPVFKTTGYLPVRLRRNGPINAERPLQSHFN